MMMQTMFFSLCCDWLAVFVKSLFKQVVLHIQLLLSCDIHGIDT